jgi:Lar family restriction alleviation protein
MDYPYARVFVLIWLAIAGIVALLILRHRARKANAPSGESYSLSPCPFCGRRHVLLQYDELKELHRVRCPGCCAQGPFGLSYSQAAERWNNRIVRIDL